MFSDIDGTLVHYPSPDAHREVWADDHGSLTGASRVHRGFSIYVDKVMPPDTSVVLNIHGVNINCLESDECVHVVLITYLVRM